MFLGLKRRIRAGFRLTWFSVVCLPAWLVPAVAGVTSSVDKREHYVEGDTAREVVRYMNSHPIHGDHGAAYASIHPNFQVDVKTIQRGGMCRAQVHVDVHFVLTLPTANTSGMSRGTRSAWNGFVSFARSHEEHHRQSYIGCARNFVAKAVRLKDNQCLSLGIKIKQMFSQMKRDCEATQRAFDRSQARILPGLALFRAAVSGRH